MCTFDALFLHTIDFYTLLLLPFYIRLYFDTILCFLNIDKALTMSPEGSNNINDCLYVLTIMAHVFRVSEGSGWPKESGRGDTTLMFRNVASVSV